MLLHLLDNGLNSLEVGLEFYSRFLFDDELDLDLNTHYGNLKFAVIGIQNSIELIVKKLLSNINDLLIYDMSTIENPDVLQHMGRKYRSKHKIHLDDFFVLYEDKFTTIPYNKCIERLALCYEITSDEIGVLTKLGYYRNILTHFGKEDIYGYYRIMINLNKTLAIFKDKLVPLINENRECIEATYIDDITEFLKRAEIEIYDTWLASNEYFINIVDDAIDNLINDSIILEEEFGIIDTSDVRTIPEYRWISEVCINFKNDKNFSFKIEHNPELDISVFAHDTKVFAFIDYDCFSEDTEKPKLFIPKRNMEFNDLMKVKSKVWNNEKNNQYNKMEFNNKAVISNYKKIFEFK